MKTPAPAPTAPPRGIVAHPFNLNAGDRVEREFADALARANARAPRRGRQQVRVHTSWLNGRVYYIQDVR